MSDILRPISNSFTDKNMGKGSVALITNEVLFSMKPVRFNGINNCIYLTICESAGASDVHPDMPTKHINTLIKELNEGLHPSGPITMPMVHRDLRSSWLTAAKILQALSDAAKLMADKQPNPDNHLTHEISKPS
jgi:hypothetical protein